MQEIDSIMARIAKHNKDNQILGAEIRSLMIMAQDFNYKVNARLKKAVSQGQIEQWDDPANEGLLLDRLETLAAKPDKDENDLVTIAAICAVLTNFVEEEEEEIEPEV
jgi:uncharacterized protein (UPF0305 family)